METENGYVRYRVNVGRTASDKRPWDATVEVLLPIKDGDDPLEVIERARDIGFSETDIANDELERRFGPKEQNLQTAMKASINTATKLPSGGTYTVGGK